MSEPEDSPQVVRALRLGWYVAEVRGRNRPGGPVPPAGPLADRHEHVLPLRFERSAPELRTEAQAVLRKLASDLGVDAAAPGDKQPCLLALVEQRAGALAAVPPGTPAADTAWAALADSIYDLDAHLI